MLTALWMALGFSASVWLISTTVLWLWKRSEEKQLKERHARLKRMAQAYDPELIPWSRLRRKQDAEDDGA